ncbi:uncharacterized protein K460DRAFT_279863 [Cucurbitaria berberidis CBS 394.84]|uniref:Phosphoribosyltransferase domain-containing protein n=1 Tax=Cucurbitaria berberidis CBS 394.84 TaxID=1168544 RepID=A0A9P4GNX9_9PLEO|nr:uncharacterized protein K460DRAFT_279863 [Cucurbitaria berberidis CBS 394.84]KAF1848909.1 hypothetical protein K460DRAFT_279863 [Cucurbitaria berberidis CBS 394.84]
MSTSTTCKPIIIGLYGVSASGKTYLLNRLKSATNLQNEHFAFHDGSALIDGITTGGLAAFNTLDLNEQAEIREFALTKVTEQCRARDEVAVIAGHYTFWPNEAEPAGQIVGTAKDWETYTHVVYLHVEPEMIAERQKSDRDKKRTKHSIEHLRKWQDEEMAGLREVCLAKGILFTTLSNKTSTEASILERLVALLKDFQQHGEELNIQAVEDAVAIVTAGQNQMDTMLMLDADRTLAPQDTGSLFWDEVGPCKRLPNHPLKRIFDNQGYSYASFRQATLLYEELADEFDAICDKVVDKVEMYPELITLLARVAETPHVGAVVVTCGLRTVWEKVLEKNGLSHVTVIGSGRIKDGYVITGSTKAHIVDKLHEKRLSVLAFGDSPLDIEMFQRADGAYVVVGDKATRSTSMDQALTTAIEQGLGALQIILPKDAGHRLDLDRLPKVNLGTAEMDFIFRRREPLDRFMHATEKNAAKLMMTLSRNAGNSGHDLREIHARIGDYLAMEYVSEIVGLEETAIPHVQKRPTDGFRFRHERNTLIVPLMRGGEPMAFGVSKAMKLASFAHANAYEDIDIGNFKGKRTIILVDAVINTGASILDFVTSLRKDLPTVMVIVVAEVIQAQLVDHVDGRLMLALEKDRNLYVVALRTSNNKFKGTGVTDTGGRLFNTTYLA